jgi:hypothetical protein
MNLGQIRVRQDRFGIARLELRMKFDIASSGITFGVIAGPATPPPCPSVPWHCQQPCLRGLARPYDLHRLGQHRAELGRILDRPRRPPAHRLGKRRVVDVGVLDRGTDRAQVLPRLATRSRRLESRCTCMTSW